jgi:enoyl-CoA hydratase/carnithine racemase
MSLVRYETDGAVALITLDRPPMNPLSGELIADLEDAVGRASDHAIRSVVVTGSPNFAAGADIAAFKAAMDAGEGGAAVGVSLSRALRALEGLPKPVVAAVRGYALGGGLELAMACDLRVMAEDARVGQPEVKLGIIPGAGGTQRLPRLVGVGRARDLVYSGRMITGAEAFAWGLADRVVPAADLDEAAMSLARELAAGATRAIAIAKRVIEEGAAVPLDEALALEEAAFIEVFGTEDAVEGVEAFLAKRPPEFRGR